MAQTQEGDVQPAGAPNRPSEQELLQAVLTLLTEPIPSENEGNLISAQNRRLRGALTALTGALRDKSTLCITLERKLDAMVIQADSLKDVASLTKDLLQIRNTELEHLQQDMNSMKDKMAEQKSAHDEVIAKMDKAVVLNNQLKTEYETQLKLFHNLKDTYAQRAAVMEKIVTNRQLMNKKSDT